MNTGVRQEVVEPGEALARTITQGGREKIWEIMSRPLPMDVDWLEMLIQVGKEQSGTVY